jgi:hypothetical protein
VITIAIISWVGTIVSAAIIALVARMPKGRVAAVAAAVGVGVLCHFVMTAFISFLAYVMPFNQIDYWIGSKLYGMYH